MYTSRRVDHWVEQLRSILGSASARQDWDERRWSENQLVMGTWTNFTKLLYGGIIKATEFREQIVQRAYECVVSAEVHRLLHMAFETKVGTKLWHAMKFLARPITDCRMLRDIASRQPQFQDVRVFLAPPILKTTINPKYQINIFEAWARFISPTSHVEIIATSGEQFTRDCAKSYSLHAEMQIFMHCEGSAARTPTLCYIGCSKKICLLCDGFLRSLPDPIATRGRHGICYPAWGVPPSRTAGAEAALTELEKMLVSRIKTYLCTPVRARKTQFAPPVPQSTLVSDFSDLTLEDLLRREEKVKSAEQAKIARREAQAIL